MVWVGLGWAGLGWAGLGWVGLGWAGLDGLKAFHGQDAEFQPGRSGDLWLHETAVSCGGKPFGWRLTVSFTMVEQKRDEVRANERLSDGSCHN